jgi:replicative DNA helicase
MNAVVNLKGASPKEADETVSKKLPYNLEIEQALLGAMLTDNQSIERVSDGLKPHHFYAGAHARIYEAILKLYERGQTASAPTLKSYFEKDQDLEKVGGAEYLFDLAEHVITTVNAPEYASVLRDFHMRRELIRFGDGTMLEAANLTLEVSAQDCLETAESQLFALAETGEAQKGFVTLRDSVLVAIEHAEKAFNAEGQVTGVTTGLRDLDKKLGGLQGSDLLILAARPSMGKTALATKMAYEAAKAYAKSGGKEGAVVGFFSLEMSSDQLAGRILADVSSISGDRIRRGDIQESDFQKFVAASRELSAVPLYIDDTPSLSIGAVRARARRLKRQHNLGLIVIDYLQLLSGSGTQQSQTSRVNEVSEITRGLKALAKELQVPVVALSQLSRAVESREDKRPQLSDLRESGSIEQDADVVMFLYREEYYLSRLKPDEEQIEKYDEWTKKLQRTANKAEVIVAKQRHGPIGTIETFFDGAYTRFTDLDTHHSG